MHLVKCYSHLGGNRFAVVVAVVVFVVFAVFCAIFIRGRILLRGGYFLWQVKRAPQTTGTQQGNTYEDEYGGFYSLHQYVNPGQGKC